MEIRLATSKDIFLLVKYDKHIKKNDLVDVIHLNRVYMIFENDVFIGWLRYNLFWDNTPFMNMLYIVEEFRNKGYGKELVLFWESKMSMLGYDYVLTSTASDEEGQFFYKKLGYLEIGGFNYKDDPHEIIFAKTI